MNPGIYTRDQVPREQYDRIARLNISRLALIDKSPAHFQHGILDAAEGGDTDAMVQGRATHLAVFEPELFRERCVVWEGKVRNGNKWDDFRTRNADKEILTVAMHANAVAIGMAARNSPHALPYLSKGRGELTLVWTHAVKGLAAVPGYEIECKGRIDFEAELDGGTIVDLKTTADASSDGFARTAMNLHYVTKAAWYSDGYELASGGKRLPYAIVAVETKAPWAVQVYRVPEELIDLGRSKYREWLDRYAFCRAKNHWPAYAEGPVDLTLPPWAYPSEDDPAGLGIDISQGA